MNFLGQVSLLVFFLLFPNGRLVPRGMGLILLLVILEQFFSYLPFRHCELASVAQRAGFSRCQCRHYLFTNLPLQTRVHPCPAPTDQVDYLRVCGGIRSCHRHLSHKRPHSTQCCPKFGGNTPLSYHLACRLSPDPTLDWVLDFALSTLRYRRTD